MYYFVVYFFVDYLDSSVLIMVFYVSLFFVFFFFFKQKTAYEMLRSLVGSEMCIRDRERTDQHAFCKQYPYRRGRLHSFFLY